MALIDMTRDEFVMFLTYPMDVAKGDGDARIYIGQVGSPGSGGLVVRVSHNGETYQGSFPYGAEDGHPIRTSWYSPDWLSDMFDDIKVLDVTGCTVEVRETGLRVIARCQSGQVLQWDIAAHVCKTHLMPEASWSGMRAGYGVHRDGD